MPRLTAYEGTLDMIVREALEKEYQRGFDAGRKFSKIKRDTSVNDLGFSKRIMTALKRPLYAGRHQDSEMPILTVGDLIKNYEGELLRRANFGRKALKEVIDMLSSVGLHLGMTDAQVDEKLGTHQ